MPRYVCLFGDRRKVFVTPELETTLKKEGFIYIRDEYRLKGFDLHVLGLDFQHNVIPVRSPKPDNEIIVDVLEVPEEVYMNFIEENAYSKIGEIIEVDIEGSPVALYVAKEELRPFLNSRIKDGDYFKWAERQVEAAKKAQSTEEGAIASEQMESDEFEKFMRANDLGGFVN